MIFVILYDILHYCNLQQDLADRRVAHALDSVTGNYSSKERQPAPVSELSHN